MTTSVYTFVLIISEIITELHKRMDVLWSVVVE